MPVRTPKARGKPRDEEDCDAIPPDELAAELAHGKKDTDEAPGALASPSVEETDGSIPGSPARQLLEAQAGRIEERGWACTVYGSLAPLLGPQVETFAFKLFVDSFLNQLNPAGPVERMMAEQLLLSHHLVGHLHVKGMNAGNPDAAKVFLAAAARLMSEFRQTALALKGCRAPAHPSGRATEPAKVPAATEPRPESRGEGPPPPFTSSELGSNHANRLKEYFDELAAGA